MSSVTNTLTWEPILSKKDLEKIVLTNNGGVDVITFKVEIKGLKDSLIYSRHVTSQERRYLFSRKGTRSFITLGVEGEKSAPLSKNCILQCLSPFL